MSSYQAHRPHPHSLGTRMLTLLQRRTFGIRWRLEKLGNRWFDYRMGTDTAAEVGLQASGLSSSKAQGGNNIYRGYWASEFAKVCRDLPADPSQFDFVDIGSGKGKVLLLAATAGFRSVTGIEYAEPLHDSCEANIQSFRARAGGGPNIQNFHADAFAWRLPASPTVYFMFNPFSHDLTAKFFRRLNQHVMHGGQCLDTVLIYANLRDVKEMPEDVFATLTHFDLVVDNPRYRIFASDRLSSRVNAHRGEAP